MLPIHGMLLHLNTLSLGNVIQNNQSRSVNADLDFVKLYNKSKYLKSINNRRRPNSRQGGQSRDRNNNRTSRNNDDEDNDRNKRNKR